MSAAKTMENTMTTPIPLETMDGNTAVTWIAYRVNEVCAIYPITPSSVMAELADTWSAAGQRNLWGQIPVVQEMQAEGFTLSAISRLIGEHGADADRFVGLRQAVNAPFATEAPEILSRAELAERFGVDDD